MGSILNTALKVFEIGAVVLCNIASKPFLSYKDNLILNTSLGGFGFNVILSNAIRFAVPLKLTDFAIPSKLTDTVFQVS